MKTKQDITGVQLLVSPVPSLNNQIVILTQFHLEFVTYLRLKIALNWNVLHQYSCNGKVTKNKPLVTTCARRNAFAVCIISARNRLLNNVVCAPGLNSFKKRLDTHWESQWYSIRKLDIIETRHKPTWYLDKKWNGYNRPLACFSNDQC